MPLSNVISSPVQRSIRFIETRMETVADRIANRIDSSIAGRIFDSVAVSIINNIETFSRSHPRAIEVLEPSMCSLLRFMQNYPLVPVTLVSSMVMGLPITLSISFLQYFALSEAIINTVTVMITITNLALLLSSVPLSATVCGTLVENFLERSVTINKLTETFLKLPPEFVAALNEWTRNESQEVDSQWSDARKKIIDFYTNTNATQLYLGRFNLYSLPDIFDNPDMRNRVEKLILYGNQLTRLPGSIGNLYLLTELNLVSNPQLRGLSSAILQLPRTCTVDISGCNFSGAVLRRIRELTSAPGYEGPRISHSMRDLFTQSTVAPSIEQSLQSLYKISGRDYNRLPELMTVPYLREWLHKLTWVADFKGSTQQTFVTKIIEYLERANDDPSFREVFSATISDATQSCGDRIALSILNLGVAYKLSTIDLKNMHELYHLLIRGVLALDLLQDIARQKIPTLRMFDEIEVYLGYPVKLKEDLNLLIDIEDMLYFGCSALSPQDLEDAKNSVLNSLKNEDMQIAFLKAQPRWTEALIINYPEAMERIGQNANTADQELINLIRKILQSFNS